MDCNPAAVATWINTLGIGVLQIKHRTVLHDFVVERGINGRQFSIILNQHALTTFNLPDITLAMATKVRKCWHRDFPESLKIQPPQASQDESGIPL